VTGNQHTRTATSNGRTLTFAEWGDHDGFPVFALHGTPGSRLLRHYDESKYVEVGARVITYDRPGYGGSDRNRGRDVVACVADVVAVADTLGLDRFAVTGASGGGPNVLALAARLPDRVTRAACVVGIAPYPASDFDWFEGIDPHNVQEFHWALDGEDVLAPEIDREAAEMLERVASDPAKLFGDDWSYPSPTAWSLPGSNSTRSADRGSPRRFATASGAGSTTISALPADGASIWPRSAFRPGSSMATLTCLSHHNTANG
jgi:pimeloyl-ACP methyl ester carboxylesterase